MRRSLLPCLSQAVVWGLASAHRVRTAAHFASWADSLTMVSKRHPHIAATMIRNLEVGTSPSFQLVRDCKDEVVVAGLDVPSWNDLSLPRPVEEAELEPNQPEFGWQQQASKQMEKKFVSDHLWPRFDNAQRALMRSQCGPLASASLTALPTSRATRIDPQPFRLFLCRRLHLPLPLSHRTCRCGRQLDQFGHHRAACPEAGVLGKRGFPLECAAAQVCREGGARVSTNVFVRDMDLAVHNGLDSRRLEVVADGLTLWRGAQLAIDTTMVSPLRRDGTTRPRAANFDGAALEVARRRKEATYPELSGEGGRARLVVLAAEVGGRWSAETAQFLTALAKARAQEVPLILQGRAETAWVRRWSAILACTATRAFALSLLDKRPVSGSDAIVSVSVVMRESRFF